MTPAQAVAALRALQPKLATDYQGLIALVKGGAS